MVGYLLCFVGPDGSGKTTAAHKLVNELWKYGYPSRYVWFRFPRFFTLLVLLTARLVGFTDYRSSGASKYGLHHFDREPFNFLYPLAVLFDVVLYYSIRVYAPRRIGYIVICDRWVHDIIIDIAIDINNLHFSNTLTGQILCRFASKADLIFVFDAPDSLLNMRRPEACLDPSIHGRRFLYRAFPKRLNEYTIYSDVSPDIIWRKTSNLVAEKIKVSFGSVGKTKIYAKVRLPVLKRIFQYRPVMLASNWFFQGVFGCTWSERLFRLTLEAIIAFPTFTLFSIWINLYISAMLSIILAHSLNWVFNGNLSALILQHNIWVSRNGVSDVAHKSRYLDMLKRKSLEMPDVVLAIATFGSLSRGEFTESSDLDVIIIRKPGFVNWVKSNFFALSLRSIAFIRKVPLDLHVLDNVDQMEGRIRPDENAVLIYDPSEVFLRKM